MRDGSSLLKSLRPGCHRGDLVSLRRLREDLRAATKSKDLAQLTTLLAEADAIPLNCEEVSAAKATKQRLEEKAKNKATIEDAISEIGRAHV